MLKKKILFHLKLVISEDPKDSLKKSILWKRKILKDEKMKREKDRKRRRRKRRIRDFCSEFDKRKGEMMQLENKNYTKDAVIASLQELKYVQNQFEIAEHLSVLEFANDESSRNNKI